MSEFQIDVGSLSVGEENTILVIIMFFVGCMCLYQVCSINGCFSSTQNEIEDPLRNRRRQIDVVEKKYDELVDNNTCCICLEIFTEKDIIYRLKCNHSFHKECIIGWLFHDLSCPLCRTNPCSANV